MSKSLVDLKNAFTLINANNKVYISGGKSESSISKAEKTLGLKFPPSYRLFLEKYGMFSLGGLEVYGLTKNEDYYNSSVPNGIWLTLQERKDTGLPAELIIISDTGYGEYYAIDTRHKDEDGENPIVTWIGGISNENDELKVFASSFGTFLYKLVYERLEGKR